MSLINQLYYSSIEKSGPLNIFSFFYDGKFDIELLRTGHNFYGLLEHSMYPWPGFKNRNFPNLHFLNNINDIKDVPLDLIIFNSRQKYEQFINTNHNISKGLHVPTLILDHDYIGANSFFIKKHLESIKSPSIATSAIIQKQLKCADLIEYHIDEKHGEHTKDIDILICGYFSEGDFGTLFALKQNFPTLKLISLNNKIPFAEMVETYEDYKNLFKRAHIFVNLSPQTNLNYDLIWALQNKCAIISTDIASHRDLLIHNTNSKIVSNLDGVIVEIKNLVNNAQEMKKLTSYSVDFSEFNTIDKWKEVFHRYTGIYYDHK
jgi:hypothetical protein